MNLKFRKKSLFTIWLSNMVDNNPANDENVISLTVLINYGCLWKISSSTEKTIPVYNVTSRDKPEEFILALVKCWGILCQPFCLKFLCHISFNKVQSLKTINSSTEKDRSVFQFNNWNIQLKSIYKTWSSYKTWSKSTLNNPKWDSNK